MIISKVIDITPKLSLQYRPASAPKRIKFTKQQTESKSIFVSFSYYDCGLYLSHKNTPGYKIIVADTRTE
jgi:hypothetical protein